MLKSINAKLIGGVVATSLAVLGLAYVFSLSAAREQIEHQQAQAEEYVDQTIRRELELTVQSFNRQAQAMGWECQRQAALFTQDPRVVEAYRLAHTGNLDDEADPQAQAARQMLRDHFKGVLAGFKAYGELGALQLHFHLPNGRSLARLWRDGWQVKRDGQQLDISDDISAFRPTVLQINRPGGGQPIRGIEVGSGGFALRGLCPVVDPEGKQLGSNEVLLALTPVLDQIRTSERQALAVYMDDQYLNIAQRLQDQRTYPRTGGFVRCAAIDATVMEQTVDQAALEAGMRGQAVKEAGDYHLITAPILDYSGQAIGVLACALDVRPELAKLAEQMAQAQQRKAQLSNRLLVMFTIGLVLLVGVLNFICRRAVLTPLAAITRRVADIAEGEGDLTQRVDDQRRDEIGELGRWFNLFVQTIHDTVARVAGTTTEVRGASNQIAAGSQQLAQSANAQASALEEVSASLQEISAMTQQSADNAAQANALAQQAQGSGDRGAQAMGRLDTALGQIKDSADQTAQIVKTIDEIAFQTNLLALNAAVEAARAGDAGKGFAVVAEEVRALARRSAEAAKSTAQLISRAVDSAEHGVTYGKEVNGLLTEIVASSTKVGDLVSEISAAVKEQADGIKQITDGMGALDQNTQETAATSEQAAAACDQLNGQVETLSRLVERFKVDQDQVQPAGV